MADLGVARMFQPVERKETNKTNGRARGGRRRFVFMSYNSSLACAKMLCFSKILTFPLSLSGALEQSLCALNFVCNDFYQNFNGRNTLYSVCSTTNVLYSGYYTSM